MITSRFRRPLVTSLAFASLVCVGHAQTAAGEPTVNGEPIELSPFEVNTSRDVGYIAENTLSGGRLNTNLLQTPADVSVLTREFLDDIAAFNISEAAQWLPNATVTAPEDNRDFGGTVTFRGMRSGGMTRDFFASLTTPQEYIVDRMEGARGPNSIVYGAGSAGGQINVITKRAQFSNLGRLNVRVDSEGSLRGSIDVNRKLNDKVAVRVNALAQEQKTWLDRYYDNRYAAAFAATVRPWKNSELRFEGEVMKTEKAGFGYVFTDTSSLWDRTTVVNAALTANPAASTGLSRHTTDKLVYGPAFNGIVNLRNFARTNGTNLTVIDQERPLANFPEISDRSFRITAPEDNLSTKEYTASVFFEHRFDNKLVIEVAATTSAVGRETISATGNNTYIDVNKVLPGGAPNPKFGQYYSEFEYQFLENDEFSNAARIAAAYPLITRWFSQTFSAVAQTRHKTFDPETYTLGRTNGSVVNPRDNNNRVWGMRYWDEPGAPLVLPKSDSVYTIGEVLIRDTRRLDELNAIQFNTVGRYFNDKLNIVAGVRYDSYDVDSRERTFDANWNRTGERVLEVSDSARTNSLGAVYFPVRSVGVYYNYSEGFTPQADENPWVGERGQVYTTTSRGIAAGLRFRLLDERIVGSVGYYRAIERNLATTVASLRTQVNQIWTDLGRTNMILNGPFSVISDTVDNKGTGYELDLTANFTRRFRMKFNFALPETEQSNSLPDIKAYVATHLAAWQAGANDPSNANRTRIGTNIAAAQNSISNFTDGRPLNGTFKWNANLFGNYTFNSGALKGFRVGGGANFYGKRLIGSPTGNPFSYIYAQEYYVLTATLGYPVKVFGQRIDLALNITNLLDYDDPNFTGVTVYQNVTYRNAYRFVEPRKAVLSATLKF
jgi:outer membrane receptor protein involved in Fe transport